MMMIHFIRPYWFLGLLPILCYLLWIIYSERSYNPWKKVCDPHLLPALLQNSHTSASKTTFNFFFILFFMTSIFALAGPAWHKTKVPIYRDVRSLMIVLDLSEAMQSNDIKPDRLTRAKFKIRDFIRATQQTQMGLTVFTQEAFVVSPLSQDANTLNALLDELSPQMMPISGSDMSLGLQEASTLLQQGGAPSGSQIWLITASAPTDRSWQIAKKIAEDGNHLHILAMFDPDSDVANAKVNQSSIQQLQSLAKVGKGSFYLFTMDSADIQSFLKVMHKGNDIVADEKNDEAYVWEDAGPWICLLLIPLALMVLREKVRYEKR